MHKYWTANKTMKKTKEETAGILGNTHINGLVEAKQKQLMTEALLGRKFPIIVITSTFTEQE